MGIYNEILTTKTIRVKTEGGGRETLNTHRYVSKQSSWDRARPWEQALIQRMENIFYERGYPKYVTGSEPGDGWPVYERIEQTYFTDDYPSTRIFAGYLRKGEGKMLHFEKWGRIFVEIGQMSEPGVQNEISTMLRDSGAVGRFQTSKFYDRVDGNIRGYVVIYSPNEHDLTMAKMILSGEYKIVDVQ